MSAGPCPRLDIAWHRFRCPAGLPPFASADGRSPWRRPPAALHPYREGEQKTEGKMLNFPPVSNQGWAIFMTFAVDGASTPNIVNSSLARTREYPTGNDI